MTVKFLEIMTLSKRDAWLIQIGFDCNITNLSTLRFSLNGMPSMDDSLLTHLRSCTNLPSPPAVASRIIELSSSNSSSLGDVADVVSIDPALSAKLLRMANSPLYARQRKIENLRQAITLFGIEGTLNIALSFSLKQSGSSTGDTGLDYNMYWKRSLSSALFCQEFGQRIGDASKDSLFLLGLLQDIGILALDKSSPDLYKALDHTQTSHDVICTRELGDLGQDHSTVGAWLLNEWNLPEAIITPISNSHHALDNDDPSKLEDISLCVAASCLMADIFVADDIESAMFKSINQAEKIIPLDRTEYNSIIESVSSNFLEMANMFDIEMGDSQALDRISEQAKEILILRNLTKIRTENDTQANRGKALESQSNECTMVNKHDQLTRLFNRRHFDLCVKQEFNNSKKYEWPLGLIFINLDTFQEALDSFGTDAGDEALKYSATLILECIRDTDIVARYGGAEFTILLPGIDKHGTEIACNRIVEAFREKAAKLANGDVVNQTVSVGAAVCYGEKFYTDWSQLIKNADDAVLKAKQEGGNQYRFFSQESRVSPKSLVG